MKRKIVKQAGSAHTITLPIHWVRERNLDAGDEIDILEREKDLLIQTDNSVKTVKQEISVVNFPLGTRHAYIAAAYCRGIDEIDLTIDKNVFPDLAEYLGYVIVDHKNNKMKIQDMNANIHEDIDIIFKRTFQIILRYFNQATTDISGEQKSNIEQIRNFDREINKLAFFLQRSVMKKTMESSSKGKLLFAFSYALEKIGDEILRMWRLTTERKVVVTKDIEELFTIVNDVLQESFSLYYRFDINTIFRLKKLKENYRSKAYPLFDGDGSTSMLLMFLTRIFDDCYDLTHLSLMKEFNPK